MFKKTILFLIGLVTISLVSAHLAQAASTNQFTITNYDINYTLSRDDAQRSILTTKETITANFSQADLNHGIERAIPTQYDGHSTSLKLDSVTDQFGKRLSYTTYDQNGNEVVRIGDANSYVHGVQTYVIIYTQRDVTKYFGDTRSDELYWDTNGTNWQVPISNLSVTLAVDDSLASALTGKSACYQGSIGSANACQLKRSGNGFVVTATQMNPGENVTVAVGFQPNTFVGYELSLGQKLMYGWFFLQIVLTVIGVGIIIWLGVRYARLSNRTREHDPIVAEYIPPKEASVNVSGLLMPSAASFTAQLIDLAVRHYLKIYQVKEKGIFTRPQYELEIIKSLDDLFPDEKEILSDIFADDTAIGSRLNMKSLQNSTAVYRRMSDNPKKLKALIRGDYSLRTKVPAQSAWYRRFALGSLIVGIVLLSPILLIIALDAFVLSYMLWPLTDKGLALMRYLKGLKLYISVAEEERIKMLQSPEGAAKVKIGDATDPKQLVKLYERTLPYAILFGQEKEWNKQLGLYYETAGTQPDWYSGSQGAVFNAAVFSSAMSGFATTATYSSASSSSSGGSSGGGSSGGGGGGGGGGGW